MSTKVLKLNPPRTLDARERARWEENLRAFLGENVDVTGIPFIVQTPSALLVAEQALSLLATGYMKVTTTTGVISSQAIPIPTTDGGTGLVSYALGDLIYASAVNVLARLAGNTSATKKWLTQTGTGSASAAPAWHTLEGTANQVTVTDSSGKTTLSAPQDLHSGASPTFANLYLGNGGVFKINSVTVLSGQAAHEADAGAASSISLGSGSDQVDRAAFNTALTGLVGKINGIRTTLNNLLAKLEGINIMAAS